MEDPHAKHAAAVAIIRHIAADLYALADGGTFDARQWRGAAGELETAADIVDDSTTPAPEPGWQPIETAPQRRKVIVSWVNECGKRRSTFAAFYPAGTLELDEAPDDMVNEDGTNAEDGWFECREAGDGIDWHLSEALTHWMPLPASPV